MMRQQAWARGALGAIEKRRGKPNEGDYRSLCMNLPVLIHQSGLAQALSFLSSRDKEWSKQLLVDLASVYRAERGEHLGQALVRTAIETEDLQSYLILTRDLIGVSSWFRRFALSELKSQTEPGGARDR